MMLKSEFLDDENGGVKNGQKTIKNDPLKNCQKSTQNCLKFDMPRGGQNRQKSTSGTRDPQNGIF
jgi:hypothetical protein